MGGNPKVVIATPELKSFRIQGDHDFIIIGSDGIFDKMSNRECVECGWNSAKDENPNSIHQLSGAVAECILKNSLMRRSLDNVTVVTIAFKNFKDKGIKGEDKLGDKLTETERERLFNSTEPIGRKSGIDGELLGIKTHDSTSSRNNTVNQPTNNKPYSRTGATKDYNIDDRIGSYTTITNYPGTNFTQKENLNYSNHSKADSDINQLKIPHFK